MGYAQNKEGLPIPSIVTQITFYCIVPSEMADTASLNFLQKGRQWNGMVWL
jgi:hypothetical protein